jgi:hypothetical protein
MQRGWLRKNGFASVINAHKTSEVYKIVKNAYGNVYSAGVHLPTLECLGGREKNY